MQATLGLERGLEGALTLEVPATLGLGHDPLSTLLLVVVGGLWAMSLGVAVTTGSVVGVVLLATD